MVLAGGNSCDLHEDTVAAAAAVEVVLDGQEHRLHLCDRHLAAFRDETTVWWGAARLARCERLPHRRRDAPTRR